MFDTISEKWALATPFLLTFYQFIRAHDIEIAIGSVCVLALWMACYTYIQYVSSTLRKIPRMIQSRGSRMTGQAREAEVRVLVADGVTDILEDLYYRNKITLDEKMQWYDRIGLTCALTDLISNKRLTVTQQMRIRRKMREHNPLGEQHVHLPTPEIVPVKPRNAFDAIVQRVKSIGN